MPKSTDSNLDDVTDKKRANGRQSFGGFNPLVEQNVKSGFWRPFYLDPFEEGRLEEEEDNDLS
jgi:hypothetical protein